VSADGAAPVMVVLTTVPSAEEGTRIGETVVREGLAACANVVPGVTSIFRWKGTVERESEALVVVKTTPEAVRSLRERIVALHSYELPEVIALEVTSALPAYAAWVHAEVGSR
jgi:periplasmic divalent cation tolerance protein